MINIMKTLNFKFRGEYYQVNEQGHIKANGLKSFSPTWIFLGGSKHHLNRHLTTRLDDAFKNPKSLENCLGWDRDHGTVRTWGGRYFGRLPRITNVFVTDTE